MLIKNVSASIFEDKQLGVKLLPGQAEDLSRRLSPQQIHQSKKMRDWMDHGLLLNLGMPKPKNKKDAIEKTKNRLASLGLSHDKMVTVRGTRPKNKVSLQSLKRQSGIEEDKDKDKYRYKDQYKTNTDVDYLLSNSTENDRQNRRTKPNITINSDRKPFSLSGDNEISEKETRQEVPGVFETGDLIKGSPSTVYRDDSYIVKNTEGKEFFIKKDIVQKIYATKCRGIGKNGKACKKQAIIGFENCLFHLSPSEKERYSQLKRK